MYSVEISCHKTVLFLTKQGLIKSFNHISFGQSVGTLILTNVGGVHARNMSRLTPFFSRQFSNFIVKSKAVRLTLLNINQINFKVIYSSLICR